MRKLILKDVMALAKIIKTGNLKPKLIDILKTNSINTKNESLDSENLNSQTSNTILGVSFAITLMEVLGENDVEQEVYKILSDIFEDDAQNMEIEIFIINCQELFKENNILSFLKLANQLTS